MRSQSALLLGFCLIVAVHAAPARAGMFDDEEARRDIAALRGQVGASQKAVEDRLGRIETLLQDRSIELSKLIDEL